MGFRYSWLDIRDDESPAEYENRINKLPPIHAGYAYFGNDGYDKDRHIYGTYIVWNGELNSKLFDPLYEYGYIIHAPLDKVERIYKKGEGLPVYVTLIVCNNRLSVRTSYLEFDNVKYVVSYTGLCVRKPEYIFFKHLPDAEIFEKTDDNDNTNDGLFNISANSFGTSSFFVGRPAGAYGSFSAGSFNASGFNIGSFNIGSFNMSSFNISSFNISSFNSAAFNMGSFSAGSFSAGSFSAGSFSLGSFNLSNFNSGNFSIGSFNTGSFNTGSFNISSFNIGSFNISSYSLGSFNLGSFNLSGFRGGSYTTGSYAPLNIHRTGYSVSSFISTYRPSAASYYMPDIITTLSPEELTPEALYADIYGIGSLGYGLNLI